MLAAIPVLGSLFAIFIIGLVIAPSSVLLLGSCLFMSLIATGLAQLYYPSFGLIRWLPPLISSLLLVHLFWESIRDQRHKLQLPWSLRWALFFLCIVLVSSLINWQGALNFIQGSKLYFSMWGLFFGLALLRWQPNTLDNALKFVLLIALIQLPFVLQQYIYIVPERVFLWRSGVVPLDVVAGTMGSERYGGGRNMVLSMFLVICFTTLTAMWRRQALKWWVLLVATPLLLTPLFLNESKFAFILLVVSLGYIFRWDIVHKPLRFLGIVIFTITISIALLVSYTTSFGKGGAILETIDFALTSNLEDSGHAGRILNRLTVLTFWAEQHGSNDITGTLIGHGLGASHETSESVLSSVKNLASTRYEGYGIGLTSLSSLLWDTGLLGTAAMFSMLATTFFSARRLAEKHSSNAGRMGLFEGMQAAILSITLMLFHSNYFVLDPTFQTLAYLLFGYLAYWTIREPDVAR